jgi:hypothetical protein
MLDGQGDGVTTTTGESGYHYIEIKPGSFEPSELLRQMLIDAGWAPPQPKTVCHQCGKEIRQINGIWMHVEGISRHLATP